MKKLSLVGIGLSTIGFAIILSSLFGYRLVSLPSFDSQQNTGQKGNFEAISMEENGFFNVMCFDWKFEFPTKKSISIFVGDSLEQQLVFSGDLQGSGSLFQLTNLKPIKTPKIFVSVKDHKYHGKLLWSQVLERDTNFSGPYAYYEKKK